MPVTIQIPTALRGFTGGAAAVPVEATTAGRALEELTAKHPALAAHLRTPDGKLRSFVNVYLNDEDIRYLDNLATAVKDGDELSIIPAVAGG